MLSDLVPVGFRSLAPWRRRDEWVDLQRSMNRMMRDIFEEEDFALPNLEPTTGITLFAPRMELQELEDKIVLCAELPGLTEKDVEVSLDKDYLTIKGEKREEREAKGAGRTFSERRYGAFERSVRLPASVDKEKVSAKFDRGILTVEVPRTPEAKREIKKIPIKH